jgi:hypothetical protein
MNNLKLDNLEDLDVDKHEKSQKDIALLTKNNLKIFQNGKNKIFKRYKI